MAGLCKWILFLALGASLWEHGFVAGAPEDICAEACWEPCFQKYGTEDFRFKEVYDELLETALEITYLKNTYNINKIGFLIDSALSSRHNVMDNPATERFESGIEIYRFEILLAMALSLLVNGQSNYLIQYDEEAAWTCDEFSCLSTSCTTVAGLNEQTPVEMTPTSHCLGNVEAACRLAQKQMLEVTCATAPSNGSTMVIAITNGDFRTNLNSGFPHESDENHLCPPLRWGMDSSSSSSSSEEYFSPCRSYFETRYVIGTHTSSREHMEKFRSKHGNYRYVHAEQFSYNALKALVNCMLDATKCCATAPAAIPVSGTTCKKTQGPFGEMVNAFPTHAATNGTWGVITATPLVVPIP